MKVSFYFTNKCREEKSTVSSR